MNDESYMRMALSLARRGLGTTAPNPSVGCVLVQAGQIVGRGWTQAGGRPHAEAMALAQAGVCAQGATAYVTLEPCAHHGVTPPCAEALVAAGIRRCVIACSDPDSRVAGKGIMALAAAGVETVTRVCESEARALNEGFFSRLEQARPWVTLKLATSLEGGIATAQGESQWITGEAARRHAQMLRAQHDAILTGIGTVLADDPQLTCRLPGLEARSPVRVVLDRRLRLPLASQLVARAREVPLWIFTEAPEAAAAPLQAAGAEVVQMKTVTPAAVAHVLAERGITRLLVEAGTQVATAFYQSGLVDACYWYRAPVLLGAGAVMALQPSGSAPLAELPRWRLLRSETLGADRLEIYARP
jgi:diaminohydroxyphosphoribosylaminopyrimidine deaminase/5-amino-6-(5-phosphoribosylamino)uracil reductase